MARITGAGAKVRRVRRLPKFDLNPLVLMVILVPVAQAAPDEFLRAAAIAVIVGVAYVIGTREGRADMAREVLRELGRDARTA